MVNMRLMLKPNLPEEFLYLMNNRVKVLELIHRQESLMIFMHPLFLTFDWSEFMLANFNDVGAYNKY